MLIPRSAVHHIVAPAIPGGLGATLLAILYQFERSEWWSPAELTQYQCKQLSHVLSHAATTVPFYEERLRKAGVTDNSTPSPELIREIPLLTRKELQGAEASIASTAIPAQHGATQPIRTTGSTGRQVRLLGTQMTSLIWLACALRDHLWHRRDLSGKLAAIRYSEEEDARPPGGARHTSWGPATGAVFDSGPAVMLTSSSVIGEQVDWLVREDPDYLITHPSNLYSLARRFQSLGLELQNLKDVSTIGERVDPHIRQACREGLGVPLKDTYTTQETGYVALQCPDHEHYHIQSENVYVEVIDAQGRACEPGESGRVILTSLNNFAVPLIRYDVGDYAEVGAPCPCGRGLPVIDRILGRGRNMLTLPSGEQHWPNFGSQNFDEIVKIEQFQLIQRSLERIVMKICAPRRPNRNQEERLRAVLHQYLEYPFDISFDYVDEIPSKGGKFEDFLSELD